MSMQDAVARFVRDGDVVVIEGFTHLISFAAGTRSSATAPHLTLCRLTPDLIYDQMIARLRRKLVFSWRESRRRLLHRVSQGGGGGPGVGVLALRHGRKV